MSEVCESCKNISFRGVHPTAIGKRKLTKIAESFNRQVRDRYGSQYHGTVTVKPPSDASNAIYHLMVRIKKGKKVIFWAQPSIYIEDWDESGAERRIAKEALDFMNQFDAFPLVPKRR